MADKFGIGSGPHELKIGNSFANRAGKNGAGHPGNFHTIRYDFKPASLDPSKSGVLAVTENSLNVKVPHSNGSTETNYRYDVDRIILKWDIFFQKTDIFHLDSKLTYFPPFKE